MKRGCSILTPQWIHLGINTDTCALPSRYYYYLSCLEGCLAEIFKSSISDSNVQPRLRTICCSRQWQQYGKDQGLKDFKHLKKFQLESKEMGGEGVEDGARGSLAAGAAMQLGSLRPRKRRQNLQLSGEGHFC